MQERNKIYIDVFKSIVNKDKYYITADVTCNCFEWSLKNYEDKNIIHKNPISEIIHDIYKEFIEREYVASQEEVSNLERHLYHYYLERYSIKAKEKCE